MNCKEIKDDACSLCSENWLCRTYLGLKPLDEYDDTEPSEKYPKNVEWEKGMPIIVTATRNPLLGVEVESNVSWSSIPDDIKEKIMSWANTEAESKMKKIVDNVGITRCFS